MRQTDPLADAYLSRLDLLLHGASPETRAEVLVGVREHLAARLPDGAGPEQVRAVLGELGSPEQIADEAYAAGPGSPSAPMPPRGAGRRWLPAVVMAVSLGWLAAPAAVALNAFNPSGLALYPTELMILLAFPVWPVILVLVAVSRLWVTREKVALVAALPALALVLLLIHPLPQLVSTVVGLLGVAATARVIWSNGRKGWHRAC